MSNWQANKVTDPEVTGIKKGIVLIDPTEVGCPALLRQPRKDGLHFVHWAYPWYCVSNNRTYTDPQSRATKLMFIRDPTDGTGWRFYFESDRGKDTLEWAGTFEVCIGYTCSGPWWANARHSYRAMAENRPERTRPT